MTKAVAASVIATLQKAYPRVRFASSQTSLRRDERLRYPSSVALLQTCESSLLRNRTSGAKEPGKLRMEYLQRLISFIGAMPSLIGRAFIRTYQLTFSALVGHHCRHLPTCSHYGDEALARHGLWAGGWMTLARLLRCHPFGTSGIDNVPAVLPQRSRWYLPWRYGRWSWRPPEASS